MVDRIRALKLAGDLALSFPGRNVTEDHAGAWADALEPLTESEANRVITLLIQRSVDPPSVAQIGHTTAEVRGTTMSPDYYGGGWRCTFMDGVECPICEVVHGHLLTHAEQREGWAELKRRSKGLEICPECDVVHIKLTHDEFIARTVETTKAMQVGKHR